MIHNYYKPAYVVYSLIFLFLAGCAQQPNRSALETPNISPTESAESQQPLISPNSLTEVEKPTFSPKIKHQSTAHSTVWDRLFSLYALPEINNARIDREINRQLHHPQHLARIQQRAEAYLYTILEAIESRNLPGELALIPAIESAFKPHAYSPSKAAGLWQFIPSTARFLGLKQNWWYDGRQDIFDSTQVATSYLKELNETFSGDWLLALASYNAGKGTVGKAIKKNKRLNRPTDYWSLDLPEETRKYVPKLLAVARILANAEKYNISLRPIADKPTFEIVDIGSQLNLEVAIEMAAIPKEDFFKFNSGLKRWCTAPEGPHRLLIPVAQVESFKHSLAQLPDHERMKGVHHKVQKGDNLGILARKYQTSVMAIRQVNDLHNNLIHPGKNLLIPVSSQSLVTNPFIENKKSPGKTRHRKLIYTVKKGDTFWDISRRFSVSSKKIARTNNIKLSAALRPGQKLLIKRGNSLSGNGNPFKPVHYIVRKGDSLSLISRKFNVSITNLRKWNANQMGKYLRPGQKLIVMVNTSRPST
jgi:peptidoglycan lytic transglycosylase D